ncbi:hypothetical protein BTHI11S_03583 [Bosea thiooxidans]
MDMAGQGLDRGQHRIGADLIDQRVDHRAVLALVDHRPHQLGHQVGDAADRALRPVANRLGEVAFVADQDGELAMRLQQRLGIGVAAGGILDTDDEPGKRRLQPLHQPDTDLDRGHRGDVVEHDVARRGPELLEKLREPDIEPVIADALEVEGRRDEQPLRPGVECESRLFHRLVQRGRGDAGIDLLGGVDPRPDQRTHHRRPRRQAECRALARRAEQRDGVAAPRQHVPGMMDEARQVDAATFPHRGRDRAGEAEAVLLDGHVRELSELNGG